MAHAVGDLPWVAAAPHGDVCRLAHLEGAHLALPPEGGGRVAGNAGEGFLGRQAEARARQVDGEQKRGARARAGVAVGGDGHADGRGAEVLDGRHLGLVDEEGRGWQEDGDDARRAHRLRARGARVLAMVARERVVIGGQLAAPGIGQLVSVEVAAQSEGSGVRKDARGLLVGEAYAFTERVDGVDVPLGLERAHRREHHLIDVLVGAPFVLGGHRVRAEEGARELEAMRLGGDLRGHQLTPLGDRVQAVARFDLE